MLIFGVHLCCACDINIATGTGGDRKGFVALTATIKIRGPRRVYGERQYRCQREHDQPTALKQWSYRRTFEFHPLPRFA